jgi:hypothetical protein
MMVRIEVTSGKGARVIDLLLFSHLSLFPSQHAGIMTSW